jgi:hypothetical protein
MDEKICAGCRKIEVNNVTTEMTCSIYPKIPSAYTRSGKCPFNFRPDVVIEKKRVGQQKQKKVA